MVCRLSKFKKLTKITKAKPGDIKGIWIDSDVMETVNQKFFKPCKGNKYPCFIIPHDVIPSYSSLSNIILEEYGLDIKMQGFFRQAYYLKALFEIFEMDSRVRKIAKEEFNSPDPMSTVVWEKIKTYTTLNPISSGNNSSLCDGIFFIISSDGCNFNSDFNSSEKNFFKPEVVVQRGSCENSGEEILSRPRFQNSTAIPFALCGERARYGYGYKRSKSFGFI